MTEHLAEFLDAVPLPALIIRRNARIDAANPAALSLFGAGIKGRHYTVAFRQPDLLEALDRGLRQLAPQTASYHTGDGAQDSMYDVTIRPVTLTQGAGVMVVFQDVSPLEHVGQMRRDFVANVSHELRTPLTALIGFIETLKGPARDDPAGQARFLDIMAHEANRMNRLVGDLLSLSRVEANERMRPTTRMDPADLIRVTVHALKPLAQKADVTLDTTLPDTPFEIIADEDQVRQVLTNLIENGLKYCGAGQSVHVSLSAPMHQPPLRTQGICLTVSDTGAGMDPIHIPRLTERFYRIDDHRSRDKGGTGLGLAIVKHIVNRHRGRLRILSRPGHGAQFVVYLPVS